MENKHPFDVAGQAVAVTGAAMGIGESIARHFAQAGARVLLVDMQEAALKKTAESLGQPWMIQDMGADGAGAAVTRRCVEEFGRLDTLVNNAGIYPQVPMLKMEEALWDKVHRLNLRGLAFACQAAGRRFVEQGGGGCIINIGSIDSVHPSMIGLAGYDASKAGVLGFTKNFALEMAPHRVRVNAIAPGGIATPGTAKPMEGSGMSSQELEAMMQTFIKAKVPMGRMGTPDEIGGVALFLASPAASYMTGALLLVDGGTLLT